jgi:hypothetical protein
VDSLITAAARALAAGNPLGALDRVALREDAPALALRGIAMAQLGDLARARILLRRAGRAFGPREALSRARCVVAEAEVALAARDLAQLDLGPEKSLETARDILDQHGDRLNAAHARYLEIRRQLLIGRLDAAAQLLEDLDPRALPPAHRATHDLLAAGIAMRRLATKPARAALARAEKAARQSGIPALAAEIKLAAGMLAAPVARRVTPGPEKLLTLAEVEAALGSGALVIDACRHMVVMGKATIALARRPILFALVRALGEAAPSDVARDALIARTFGGRHADESQRARLRVEVARLRAQLRGIATIGATRDGFALVPRGRRAIMVLARPVEEKHAGVLAFLADGESWSSSALALAMGVSQRSVQRALDSLAAEGKVQFFGHGRARRWVMPPLPGILGTGILGTGILGAGAAAGHAAGFTTALLLTAPLPGD